MIGLEQLAQRGDEPVQGDGSALRRPFPPKRIDEAIRREHAVDVEPRTARSARCIRRRISTRCPPIVISTGPSSLISSRRFGSTPSIRPPSDDPTPLSRAQKEWPRLSRALGPHKACRSVSTPHRRPQGGDMDETYRMLGREHEADLEREAARRRLAAQITRSDRPRRRRALTLPAAALRRLLLRTRPAFVLHDFRRRYREHVVLAVSAGLRKPFRARRAALPLSRRELAAPDSGSNRRIRDPPRPRRSGIASRRAPSLRVTIRPPPKASDPGVASCGSR